MEAWGGLIPALIQSHNNGGEIPFCRCNRRPVYAACLHNQIQTLFSTISLPALSPPPPSLPPLSLSFSFFSKGQNPSERQHLCFATCECVVHPFHFPVPLQDSEPANSLCYRFHSIYFCRVFKTSHAENHLLTNHSSISLLVGWGRFLLGFLFGFLHHNYRYLKKKQKKRKDGNRERAAIRKV